MLHRHTLPFFLLLFGALGRYSESIEIIKSTPWFPSRQAGPVALNSQRHPVYTRSSVNSNSNSHASSNSRSNLDPSSSIRSPRYTSSIKVSTTSTTPSGTSDQYTRNFSKPIAKKREDQLQNVLDSRPSIKNKPLLYAMVTKLEFLSKKLDELSVAQNKIQDSFSTLENRYVRSVNNVVQDYAPPQCERRMDHVIRNLNPLVSKVEELWSMISNYGSIDGISTNGLTGAKSNVPNNINVAPSQFLSTSGVDALLSESRRQERAITAMKSDMDIQNQEILSELGTVEQQLDLLRNGKNAEETNSLLDQAQGLGGGVQRDDVSLELEEEDQLEGNGTLRNPSGVPAVVFPSVKNKPSADSSTALDGAEALLTGSGQTGASCAELIEKGHRRSGLYHLRLPGARSSFWQLLVYCDQVTSGGGWMVVQRRADFGEPRESFHRNWVEYRSGFGDPLRELWMGNLNLHLLTSSEDQVLRIELEDFEGQKRYAEYSTFRVASETDSFRLEVGGYSGDAGDALSDPWYGAHGSAFSTYDRDNDRSSLNCASMLKGGWWWKSCGRGLNGLYFNTQQSDSALARQGIVWFRWKGWDYTLKSATMMIRPKSFQNNSGTYFP